MSGIYSNLARTQFGNGDKCQYTPDQEIYKVESPVCDCELHILISHSIVSSSIRELEQIIAEDDDERNGQECHEAKRRVDDDFHEGGIRPESIPENDIDTPDSDDQEEIVCDFVEDAVDNSDGIVRVVIYRIALR